MKRSNLIAFATAIALGSIIGSLVPANAGPLRDAVGGVARAGKQAVVTAGVVGLRAADRAEGLTRRVARRTADTLNKF